MIKLTPNLFKHAYKELSQDAFLAWLCEWADPALAGDPMHAVGTAFIRSLHEQLAAVEIAKLKVHQQMVADVLLLIETRAGARKAVIIEDKVMSSEHSNQLEKYRQKVLSSKTLGISGAEDVYGVYYKIYEQSSLAGVTTSNYVPYPRKKMIGRC